MTPPRMRLYHGADTYEFLPGAYQLLNQSMRNLQVISPIP